MDGHWTPHAHDEELHDKGRCDEAHVSGDDVRGDQSAADNTPDDHGETSTSKCGNVSQDSPSDNGANLANAGDDCGLCGVQIDLVLKECWIEILRL